MESLYLLFKAGGLYFMIPLEQVVSVESLASARTMEFPVYDFGQACHLYEKPVRAPYILIVRFNETKIGMAVEWVEDIRKTRKTAVHKLRKPVIGPDNQYLDSAVALEGLDLPLAYLLDMSALFKKLADCSEAILE